MSGTEELGVPAARSEAMPRFGDVSSRQVQARRAVGALKKAVGSKTQSMPTKRVFLFLGRHMF